MQFNSFIFIMLFLPVMLVAYFTANRFHALAGKLLLIAGSVLFYAYTDWKVFTVLGISLVLNFLFTKLIEHKEKWHKLFLFIPVAINTGMLLYFKYTNFFITNLNSWFNKDIKLLDIALPIGISFFTFQQIAYLVAVYRKEIEKADVIDYLAYILYFPKMLMGPLADPVDFLGQLNNKELKKVNWDNITYGVKIFSFGLFKKLMIADICANAVNWGYANIKTATSADWILVMLFYTFEIYFDFSGYSDMAVGVSKMFNITLPMNFDSPYKAVSIRDFWKRWHMSLTKFFTKYIYIPLGGSKKGEFFTYLNTMIIFLISGIWHGANWTFIVWGILHGLFSIFDRVVYKLKINIFEPFRWLLTFIVVNFLWLLFRSESIDQWVEIVKTIVSFKKTSVSSGLINNFTLPEWVVFTDLIPYVQTLAEKIRGFWMLVYIAFSSWICFVPENNYRKLEKISLWSMIPAAVAFVWAFICLSGESVFVYFNF